MVSGFSWLLVTTNKQKIKANPPKQQASCVLLINVKYLVNISITNLPVDRIVPYTQLL